MTTDNPNNSPSTESVAKGAADTVVQAKRKLRVVHLLHYDGTGGGPRSINRMLNYFHTRHELVVIAGGRGRLFENCRRLEIPFHQIPIENKLQAITYGFWILVWKLIQIKPDILVLHGQWGGPIGALAGKLARWPAFYTSWDCFRALRNHWAERIPCSLCDRVIYLSESVHAQYLLRRLGDEDQAAVIPNSIDSHERPDPEQVAKFRAQWGWSESDCNVVSVGRLTDQKKVLWLLQGWSRVLERCPQARLWIVGSGPRLPILQDLARNLKLGDRCVFTGPQVGIVAMAASDIVAMTSLYEGMSSVPLEAMLCGKPIVASAADGVRDSVQHGRTGFLVQVGSVRAMADRIIELIENPELRRKMGAAAEIAVQEYDTPKVMSRYEEFFATVGKVSGFSAAFLLAC